MNTEPTKVEIKEFWEKLGYSVRVTELVYSTEYALEVDYSIPIRIENTIDLNNLFKYAYPVIKEKVEEPELAKLLFKWVEKILADKDPARALFKAISKLKINRGTSDEL